jgi:simple sugar transport system permease protein
MPATTSQPTDKAAMSTTHERDPRLGRALSALGELRLIPVILVVGFIGFMTVPHFMTKTNIVDNILEVSAVLGIVVIAQSIILIGGYFDLSMQSVVGLAPMLAAWLVTPAALGGSGAEINQFVALGVIFGVGALVGLINGVLVGRLGLNAFMVTLAMLILLQGFTLGISNGQTFSDLPETMTFLGTARIATVPLDVWLVLFAFVVAGVFMRYHPTGRRIYAMGGNADAARAAGIRTLRLTIGIFIVGGMLAALGGLLFTSRVAAVTANQGQNLIFTVFAAAVIGGISLNGGRGSIIGAGTGVLLLGMIQNLLVLSNVPSFWIDATYGAIILAALLIGSDQAKDGMSSLWRRLRPEPKDPEVSTGRFAAGNR